MSENDAVTYTTYRNYAIRDGAPRPCPGGIGTIYPFTVFPTFFERDLADGIKDIRARKAASAIIQGMQVVVIDLSKREAVATVCDWIDYFLYAEVPEGADPMTLPSRPKIPTA